MRREELEYHTSEHKLSRADKQREGGEEKDGNHRLLHRSNEAMYRYVSCGLYAALHALDKPLRMALALRAARLRKVRHTLNQL